MTRRRNQELRDALRGLMNRARKNHAAPTPGPASHPAVNTEPSTAFEALLRQQMESLEKQLQDLRGRINNLFILIVGTVALQAVLRVAGL